MATTSNFGLTRVRRGESLSKNGHSALDGDRVVLDDLLYALANHAHDAAPPLASPDDPPTLEAHDDDGALPGDTTFFYVYSFLDRWGLETSPSPEQSVTTPEGGDRPSAPILEHVTEGGELGAGRYQYAITYLDPDKGGETEASPAAAITLSSSSCQGECKIELEFDEPPSGFPCINIYRTRPGQTRLYFLDRVEDVTTYVDDGFIDEDQSITAPRFNSTGRTNRVVITLPESPPEDATAWRLYRTTTSGRYSDASLVHTVVETEEENGGPLVTEWEDDGSSLLSGRPRERSVSLGGGALIDLAQLQGRFPLDAMPRGGRHWGLYAREMSLTERVLGMTPVPHEVFPTHLACFFQDPPEELSDARLRLRLSDGNGSAIDLMVEGGQQYFSRALPLTDAGQVEAQDSNRHSDVPVVSAPEASGSQAVLFSSADQWAEADFGDLDAGPYKVQIVIQGEGEVRMSLADGGAQSIASEDFTFDHEGFELLDGPQFEIEEDTQVLLTVTRLDEGEEDVLLDLMLYQADLPSLQEGDLRVSTRLVPDDPVGEVSSTMAGYDQDADTDDLLGDLEGLGGVQDAFVVTASVGEDELVIDLLAEITGDSATVAEGDLDASDGGHRTAVRRAIERALGRFFFVDGEGSETGLDEVLSVEVDQDGTDFVISFTIDDEATPDEGDDVFWAGGDPHLGGDANVSVWF